MRIAKISVGAIIMQAAVVCNSQGAARLTTIYQSASGPDALVPNSVLSDGNGGFYGTMTSGAQMGEVFHLTPPAETGGVWTETAIYTFTGGAGGTIPNPGLTMDGQGNLYGSAMGGTPTAVCSTGCGVVFQLTPPSSESGGGWTENVLYAFTGAADGGGAYGALAIDKNGALYGAAPGGGAPCSGQGCGVVFRLTPPGAGGAWSYRVLYSFQGGTDATNPMNGVILGKDGALYGATERGGPAGDGAVFQLKPPKSAGGAWSEELLYGFAYADPANGYYPSTNLVSGPNGTLYGGTSDGGDLSCAPYAGLGCGVVYSLTPPTAAGGAWTYAVIEAFDGSQGYVPLLLVALNGGELLGLTESGPKGNGSIFALKPPTAGGGFWSQTTVWNFTVDTPDSLIESGGKLYGTTRAYYQRQPSMGRVFQAVF
ncbi:MAG: choice-of-anchor tandem repeat GloVer-containing protein [Bryobacteraceae bacterium]